MTAGQPEQGFAALELRDRAVRFLSDREAATEDDVLAHVFGGPAPAALHARLAAPLLADPRLERRTDGSWTLRAQRAREAADVAFTALALVATGPSPGRARVVRVCALHVERDHVLERFDATFNPGKRVPRYVAERIGLEPDVLDSLGSFGGVLDDLVRFLGDRPVLSQDVQLTWQFLEAEAHQLGRVLVVPMLLDLNELAVARLALKGKPSLSLVAAQLGISSVQISHPDEEARVLALAGTQILAMGGLGAGAASTARTLRRGATARSLPDEPGVYVLRDREQTALYVGKARRLRSRLASYVHRPLGATRRLEGLVAAVHEVDSTHCANDLEALIVEDREIRRLQPRFNTVRQQRAPRYWIRLPAAPVIQKRAPRRLELSSGPSSGLEGEFVGPFRNEMLAQQARLLAQEVFELDELRRADALRYADRLAAGWSFLRGESGLAEALARQRSVQLLRRVLAFDVRSMLLPADPREARYAVVRPGPTAIEGFLLDHAVCRAWTTFEDEVEDEDVFAFARRLLAPAEPRTTHEDTNVVLRWFGAQRPPTRLVWLADEPLAAADAIETAVLELLGRET
jgi:hypothetical protein